MQKLYTFIKSILILAVVALCGSIFGWFLGSIVTGILITLSVALFWHIYSGQNLLERVKHNRLNVSGLLATPHDNQLQTAILEKDVLLNERQQQVSNLQLILRESAEALPHGIIVINDNKEIEWANKKATEYIGVRDPEDVGQRIGSLIHHLHFSSLLTGESNEQDGKKYIEIDGLIDKKMRLRLSFTSFADHYRMIAVEDITNFSRVDKMRQDFIGNASHELRTPLTVIRGYLEEMLEDEKIPDYWNKPMQAMDKQVLRMQNIIEGMLTLSNIESRLSLAGQESVHLKSLIDNISHDLLLAFQDSHKIDSHISDGIYIKGEEVELYSIFSNLIKNAFLYSPKGSVIKIEWLNNSKDYNFVVSDKGQGIPKESIQRLTERFYRVDMGRSREHGGTGLGLAIVKHALMRHEAFLEIESDEGHGSRFICHFPQQRVVLTST